MDLLEALTASRSRADVLAALFLDDAHPWGVRELGRAAQQPHQNASRELEWLVEMGLVRAATQGGRTSYTVVVGDPLGSELGRLIRQARGHVPGLRKTLLRLSQPMIAWLTRTSSPTVRYPCVGSDLIVLSSVPKSVVELQLSNVAARDTRVHPMSVAEWVTRLQKGELLVRQARRARKLWVVGSWDELRRLEQRYLESRRTLTAAMSNWREELSDEWDEDYDPLGSEERIG
ncbi:MAG: hypothetical protein KGN00_00850 [Chloroflexota bacterium]|nr:hypothetical protein [Chloroflexota bacterium]MDE3192208.1 hypothetical protein [Chloroflexota bacterium]